jgi:hypothetical protein
MARSIVVHVGTTTQIFKAIAGPSLLEDIFDDRRRPDQKLLDEQMRDRVATAIPKMVTAILALWSNKENDDAKCRVTSPAEIASLSKMIPPISTEDHIVLLHTDTADGRFCSQVLQAIIKEVSTVAPERCFPHTPNVNIAEIRELKVENATRDFLLRHGMSNYISAVGQAFDDLRQLPKPDDGAHHELIINITGGYKALIPMARDACLILSEYSRVRNAMIDVSLAYLYEDADEIVQYHALPVSIPIARIPLDYLADSEEIPQGIRAHLVSEWPEFFEKAETEGFMRPSALGTVALSLGNYIKALNA